MRDSTVHLVGEAIDLIEERLNKPLWLQSLAEELYISKFHLHRLFKSLTGKTLMSYVRGRRLSRSLRELLITDAKISDIARGYCFNYEQSYERAFKYQFGISPTAFRNSPREMEIVNMFDIHTIRDIASGIFTQPRFCIVPQLKVAGICTRIYADDGYLKANKAALSFCYTERGKIASRINEHIYLGFTFPISGKDYVYMPCVEVTETESLLPQFEGRIFPAHMYAVFRYIGFHSPDVLSDYYIGEIYEYIESEWSPKTTYQRNKEYHFERMDSSVCSSTYCEADIYIPVSDVSMPVQG